VIYITFIDQSEEFIPDDIDSNVYNNF
jgi:hypothetical protein